MCQGGGGGGGGKATFICLILCLNSPSSLPVLNSLTVTVQANHNCVLFGSGLPASYPVHSGGGEKRKENLQSCLRNLK